MERRTAGATKWKRCTICTSELTFLGRATAKGGVIGLVAGAAHAVDTMEKLTPNPNPNPNQARPTPLTPWRS